MTVATVVTAWTLCTIPDPAEALVEMRRVLRPDGRLIFVEHGRPPARRVRVWPDRLDSLWTRVAGGCHLDRTIDERLYQRCKDRGSGARDWDGPAAHGMVEAKL